MKRILTAFATTVALIGCAEENSPRRCEREPDFVLSLSSPTEVFPGDAQIQVTFGGGSTETYRLGASGEPEVLFCETSWSATSDPSAGGAGGAPWAAGGKTHAGASGAVASGGLPSINCEIWSAGPATISIRAAGWHTTRELKPDPELCTMTESIVIGEPDPKP